MAKTLHPNRKFGDDILQLPITDRVEFFADKQIKHQILSQAYDELLMKAKKIGGVEFIEMVGPTGAGKSCAARKFVEDKLAESQESMKNDPRMVPVISVQCPASIGGKFAWDPLLKSILRTGGDALIDSGSYALEFSEGVSQKEISKLLLKDNKVSDLVEVIQNFLFQRQVRYLIIDEAQHIIDACRTPLEALQCMELLKSLASLSGCIIVLVGTYRLLRFGETSAQLGRRSEIIELGPYHRGSQKDLDHFAYALDGLLARYPIRFSDALFDKVSEIHLGCCGCIGILKDWLTKTLYRTLESGGDYVSVKSLMDNRMDPRELNRVAAEIKMGKDYFSRVTMFDVEDMLLGGGTQIHKKSGPRGVQRKPSHDPVGPQL
ncbi:MULTISPECIES: TniB family NTP-binding protein [unclassified Endozoicomonas]|uniref:TniB family NTP-binding protein n=1 Tax=unclassified Endozoicomonas TaxID=2644528 RepID=UPI003BB4C7CC